MSGSQGVGRSPLVEDDPAAADLAGDAVTGGAEGPSAPVAPGVSTSVLDVPSVEAGERLPEKVSSEGSVVGSESEVAGTTGRAACGPRLFRGIVITGSADAFDGNVAPGSRASGISGGVAIWGGGGSEICSGASSGGGGSAFNLVSEGGLTGTLSPYR